MLELTAAALSCQLWCCLVQLCLPNASVYSVFMVCYIYTVFGNKGPTFCRFRKKRNARIQSASTMASKFIGFKSSWLSYSVWGILQEKVYKRHVTDLDDLKHHISTEWTKLDHAVIAAAVHQWCRCLSVSVKAGGSHFEDCLRCPHCVCNDNCDLSWCRWSVEQLHANRPVWFSCSCQLWLFFAIHDHCLICKVKQRQCLGEADFRCVSSFAFFTIFLAKNYNCMFEFVKVMSKEVSLFFPQTWCIKMWFS